MKKLEILADSHDAAEVLEIVKNLSHQTNIFGVSWRDLEGDALNAELKIYGSNFANDTNDFELKKTINLNSEDNKDTKTHFELNNFELGKIAYAPVSVTAGELNIDLLEID